MSKFSRLGRLTRTIGHRKSLMRNMLSSLILHESIKSTAPKVHVLKSYADRVLSKAKKNDTNAKKYVVRFVNDKAARKKVFDVLVPRYVNRVGGYTQVFRIGKRLTDNAEMALIKLIA